MESRDPPSPGSDRVLLLLLLALLVLLDPIRRWWTSGDLHWLWPFLLWGALIGFTALLYRRGRGGL